MVVVYHAIGLWSHDFSGKQSWENGAAGVDIFFVISGFVMAISDSNVSASQFLKKRFFRVMPLYWLLTALMLVKMQVHMSAPAGSEYIQTPLSYVVSSLLLIPYKNSVGLVQPILAVGWTLSFEMFFYLLFAAALWLRVGVVRFLSAALILLSAVGLFRANSWPDVTVLLDPILLEFLAGVILGSAFKSGWRMNPVLSAALGVVGLGILFAPVPSFLGGRPLVWGTCALLIVQAVVMLEDRISPPKALLSIGDASYSLYLCHVFAIQALARIFIQWGFRDLGWMVAESLIGSILASLLLYRFIEKPLLNRKRKPIQRHIVRGTGRIVHD